VLTGCATQLPMGPSPLSTVQGEFDIAPKQMVEVVHQTVTAAPLSLTVESTEKGTILTGYQRFEGEWHILRRWQEQTRYKITVIPDWDQPMVRCRVQVTDETETRATEGQTWDRAPELDRQDRSRQLLDRIRQAVQKLKP